MDHPAIGVFPWLWKHLQRCARCKCPNWAVWPLWQGIWPWGRRAVKWILQWIRCGCYIDIIWCYIGIIDFIYIYYYVYIYMYLWMLYGYNLDVALVYSWHMDPHYMMADIFGSDPIHLLIHVDIYIWKNYGSCIPSRYRGWIIWDPTINMDEPIGNRIWILWQSILWDFACHLEWFVKNGETMACKVWMPHGCRSTCILHECTKNIAVKKNM